MIQYKGKDYTELNFNECVEFEKELLQKVLIAGRSNMSDAMIHQLNVFIDLLRDQKAEAIRKEMKSKNDSKEDGSVLDTDPSPELEILNKPAETFTPMAKQQVSLTRADKMRIAQTYKPVRDPEAVKLAEMYKNDK